GLFVRHRLEEEFDGLSADDLFISDEQPIGDLCWFEFDLIALVLAGQIARLISAPAGKIAIWKLLHIAYPDVLKAVGTDRKSNFQPMSGFGWLRRIIGCPERGKRIASTRDRSVHIRIGAGKFDDRWVFGHIAGAPSQINYMTFLIQPCG